MGLSKNLLEECQRRLVDRKSELLNQARAVKHEFRSAERTASGDEVDQSVNLLAEHGRLVAQERIRGQLYEIELALSRIESGTFGKCEETEELIETDRLLAIPWTRLSIEGAEIREAVEKRFAK